MTDQARVTIVEPNGQKHAYWALKGKSLWEILEIAGWNSGGSCGGRGICGKCKVRTGGELSSMDSDEREQLMADEITNGYRLSCHAVIEGDIEVFMDHQLANDTTKNRLCHASAFSSAQAEVGSKQIFISGLQREYPVPILDRIKAAMPEYNVELTVENLNELARIDRPGRPTIELNALVMDGQRVSYITKRKKPMYGLALDLGSTSLFAAMVDLETGQMLSVASQTNMQRIYGDDIISRVSYCIELEDGTDTLHRILINNINAMIDDMITQTGIEIDSLLKITAVGNPVMVHLFLGLSTSGFGLAPYTGIFSGEISYSATQFGLHVNPIARILILPLLGGFVGADTTACLLTLTDRDSHSFLMIDIGTNGEIVLGHRGKMWTTSAAAGPAFEGGAISCGMRAGQGAIDGVSIIEAELSFSVIGGGPPRGICGSGLIELVSGLLDTGCINENGTFSEKARQLYQVEQGLWGEELVLLKKNMTGSGSPLLLTQEDLRQVQLAKSAIRTAIDILLDKANLTFADLSQVYLAGAFGHYLRPDSLIKIGMIPKIDPGRVKNIGNAAAEGAILALLSDAKVREARNIKQKVHYVELADQKEFQEVFMANIHFPAL